MNSLHDLLSPALVERTRILGDRAPRSDGAFVLYWMHHAMRAHDNPALDAAIACADALGKPVLVYQGLGGNHAFNSDRHHLFILQGARDVARALEARGIAYAFHAGDGPSPLRELIDEAALAVFEQMPVAPFNRWQPALAASTDTPVISVDARCIVPMQWLGRACDRAFRFRDQLKHEYPQRILAGWQSIEMSQTTRAQQSVFKALDVGSMHDRDLHAFIATLPINHAIGPVADTPGGTDAGYQRWRIFRERGLKGYHRHRNDAETEWPQGVSRMSAYLHYGQVSPFRIAAEAQQTGGAGADKFLEELTIWRELAHNFCFHCSDPDSLSALPDWAQKTLDAHRNDPREKSLSLYRLQQADSGSTLWDLAQRSLIAHGELHNNLRMTWAKAIVSWTPTPELALEGLIDLNHRYALDGNDPSSYGGLLWALGLFDRPFEPAQPALGTVRGRSVAAHAKRLDMDAYRARVERCQGPRLRIAVIGAGIAGLSAARVLADHNHDVVVVEKSRGPGGRTATRRRDTQRYDHGAQYFTARDARLARHLPSWQADGIIERWPQRVVTIDQHGIRTKPDDERWRGVGGMNALAKSLASGLDLRTHCRVDALQRVDSRWQLDVEADVQGRPAGDFDCVLVSAPAPQAGTLLVDAAPALASRIAQVAFSPCWAAMLDTARISDEHWQAAFVEHPVIAWLGTRSGDAAGTQWVIHASEGWSAAHLEDTPGDVARVLRDAFEQLTGLTVSGDVDAHRWRYARVQQPLTEGCLFDPALGIGVCGDWCHGQSRIESAWLSGQALAGRVLASAALAYMPEDGMQPSLL